MIPRILFIGFVVWGLMGASSLKAQSVCTLNGSNDWYPISFMRDEKFQGVMVDVAREVAKLQGITLKIGGSRPWKRILHELEKGNLSIIAGSYFTEERAKKFAYSLSITDNNIQVFVKKGNEFSFNTLADLRGKTGLRPAGGSYGQMFDDYAKKHLMITETGTGAYILKMLLASRKQYAVLARKDGLELINREFSGKITMLPKPVVVNEVFFLFARNNPCYALLDRFNEGIQKLKEQGTISTILSQYP